MTPLAIKKGRTVINDSLARFVSLGLTGEAPMTRAHVFSMDGGYCPRRAGLFMHVTGTMPRDAASEFYFGIGNAIHRAVMKGLTAAGVVLAEEWGVKDESINLVGYVDAIVKLDGNAQVLEIKSCGTKLPDRPKSDHECQAITYSIETGLPDPIILYVSRQVASFDGKLLMQQFTIDNYGEKLKAVAKRLAISHLCAKAKVLAPVPKHIRSERNCGFCPFKDMCWHGNPFPLSESSLGARKGIMDEAAIMATELLERMPERAKTFETMAPKA